jgi:hypothetical protein
MLRVLECMAMLKVVRHVLPIIFAALTVVAPVCHAGQTSSQSISAEGVISFDSDVTVNVDSTIMVRESITVLAKGEKIKDQVCREIPTIYSDRFGNPYNIHLEVGSVDRDDQQVDYHLERMSNGLRVCMGSRGKVLSPGEHTYELIYVVNRELGFFTDFDELYWNVTGNGWKVPIQSTTATVHLPKGISQIAILLDGYTGKQGSVANNFTASADTDSNATFRTRWALEPGEGLTLVVRWPNGFVHPPTEAQLHQYYLDDRQSNLIGLLGLGVILLYYVLVWFVAGRGRSKGDIRARSEPPHGLSPAALRHVWRLAFDQKTMVVNLVDLAVKKQIAILEDAGGAYILGRIKTRRRAHIKVNERDPQPGEVTTDEKLVLEKVFAAGDPVALKPANHAQVGGAVEALHLHLRIKLEWIYFVATSRYVVPGLLISLAAVIRSGLVIQGVQAATLIPVASGVMLCSLALIAVGGIALSTFQNALSDPLHTPTIKKQSIILGSILLVLVIAEIAGLGLLVWATSDVVALLLVVLIAINYFFHLRVRHQMLSSHTIMEQIEGLRLFLVTSSEERGEPGGEIETPGMFEKLLPYALALNVEKIWGEKFASTLTQMPREEGEYAPTWYSGPNWHPVTAAAFLTSLANAFSSAISWSVAHTGSNPAAYGPPPQKK